MAIASVQAKLCGPKREIKREALMCSSLPFLSLVRDRVQHVGGELDSFVLTDLLEPREGRKVATFLVRRPF